MKASLVSSLVASTLLATGVASVGACGSSSPGDSASGDGGSGGSGNGHGGSDGADATTPVVVAPPGGGGTTPAPGADASTPDSGATPTRDAGPLPVVDCNEQPDPSQAFVAPDGSASGNCLMASPCSSIQRALSLAAAAGQTTVYVAQGTYTEQITLSPGIKLRGGWSQGDVWTPICGDARATATKLVTPAGLDRSVVARNLGGAASIEAFAISNMTTATAGQTLYGIFATGTATVLTLTDVTVTVANGGGGSAGGAGAPGFAGSDSPLAGCLPATDPPTMATMATAATTTAAPVAYSAAGATVSTGAQGVPGGPGQSGNASAEVCVSDVSCARNPNEMNTCEPTARKACGSGAPGYCGGPGGVGGAGGSGGSSIALYAWDASVTLFGGALLPGTGGNGGSGGSGGAAGIASAPGRGGTVSGSSYCSSTATTCTAGPITNTDTYGAGGAGTNGAAGVAGGGGAGGDAFNYYANANNVSQTGCTLPQPSPSLGGSGTPAGPAGLAGVHNEH